MTEPFTNEPIDVEDLPRLRDEAFVPVDPRYLRASLLAFAATAGVIAGGGALIASGAEQRWTVVLITAALLGLIGLGALLRTLEVRRLAYQVRAHDLSMRSGVITHRTESLPFVRVQHVRIHRGAIERSLGLATLHVSSAGPNITIPGLAEADAERIKRLVTERAGDLDEADTDETGNLESPTWTPPPPDPTAPPPPAVVTPPPTPPPPSSRPIPSPPVAPPSPPSSWSTEQVDREPPTPPT